MTRLRDHTGSRRWGAALAAIFCGYLTLATSEIPMDPCFEEQSTALQSLTHEAESETTWWRLTAVTPTPVLRWHVQVSPALSITYVAPDGVDVPAFAEPSPAGLDTEASATVGFDSATVDTAAPPASATSDHVLIGVGSFTLVCGGHPSLCDDVKFSVHGQVAEEFTLSAFAVRRGCAPEGELMDLRLEPTQP